MIHRQAKMADGIIGRCAGNIEDDYTTGAEKSNTATQLKLALLYFYSVFFSFLRTMNAMKRMTGDRMPLTMN